MPITENLMRGPSGLCLCVSSLSLVSSAECSADAKASFGNAESRPSPVAVVAVYFKNLRRLKFDSFHNLF